MGPRKWVDGEIIALWDKGSPYRIRLEDGSDTWAPVDSDSVIRKAKGWRDSGHIPGRV